jgi:hypothetical protein
MTGALHPALVLMDDTVPLPVPIGLVNFPLTEATRILTFRGLFVGHEPVPEAYPTL